PLWGVGVVRSNEPPHGGSTADWSARRGNTRSSLTWPRSWIGPQPSASTAAGRGRLVMTHQTGVDVDYQALFQRASLAATLEACEECLTEIGQSLESVTAPADRARLLMCRARVRSNQWRTADVCDDARAAMRLFEMAGKREQAVDAASLGAAHASRLGELSLASELATKSILALDSVTDDLRVE